jgi:hypothetical protein
MKHLLVPIFAKEPIAYRWYSVDRIFFSEKLIGLMIEADDRDPDPEALFCVGHDSRGDVAALLDCFPIMHYKLWPNARINPPKRRWSDVRYNRELAKRLFVRQARRIAGMPSLPGERGTTLEPEWRAP